MYKCSVCGKELCHGVSSTVAERAMEIHLCGLSPRDLLFHLNADTPNLMDRGKSASYLKALREFKDQ